MADQTFVNLKLRAASPTLLTSAEQIDNRPTTGFHSSTEAPQAEWAAEAIANVRHVVAGVSFALLVEGAVAVALIATWNFWHIR